MPILKAVGLYHHYQHCLILRDFNYTFERGLYWITGPSGSGKTTLLKILSGILKPLRGKVWFESQPINGLLPDFAWVFQNQRLLESQTPIFHWWMTTWARSIPRGQAAESMDQLARAFEIQDVVHEPIGHLSVGQRVRVELVKALLGNPRVLFADEPTASLDLRQKEMILRQLIRWLEGHPDRLALVVTHDWYLIDRVPHQGVISLGDGFGSSPQAGEPLTGQPLELS